jgi:regulator of protease activity HflC (stomatin/prohibitin superfamily)
VGDRRQPSPYSLEYWAAESVLERPDQRALMREHIRRTQVRLLLLACAAMAIILCSTVLEYVRVATGGMDFSPVRWLAGMVPGLVGLIAVLGVSAAFVREVYTIRDWYSALGYVRLLLLGRAPLSAFDRKSSGNPIAPYPSITVRHGRIDEKHEDTLLARFGGPGNVTIFNDSAVFLERFGRLTRVAGPGKIFLRRFERIHAVLDLRPQERSSTAKAVTKDGIPVQAEVQVRFQLARPPANQVPPTPDAPHPVYQWALVRAGQSHKYIVIKEKGEEAVLSWAEQVGVGGAMRATIADYRLDQLLEPFEPGRDPRREISGSLQRAANNSARNIGAEVLEVRMGPLEPALEEVTQERISSWQATWASRARKEEARGEAEAIRERGLARAYAQMEIILSLAREFQDTLDRKVAPPAEIVILRFMEALRQTWSGAGAGSVSSQVFAMWKSLQRDLQKFVEPDHLLPKGEPEAKRLREDPD